jgi:lysyl endopeptidase
MQRVALALALALGIAPAADAARALSAEPKRHVAPRSSNALPPALKLARGDAVPTTRVVLAPPTADERKPLDAHNAAAFERSVQIGFARAVTFDPAALRWIAVPDGGRAARFSVTSPSAAALRLGLAIERMDDGVELRFFGSTDPTRVYGPITARQIRLSEPVWWSPVIEGDTLTAEIFLAEGTSPQAFRFALRQISHLVATVADAVQPKLTPDPCVPDVACLVNPPAGLIDATKAVAKMVFTRDGDTLTCTGTLLADTEPSSARPYFYTAAHCIREQSQASSLNTYWFYEALTCGSTDAPNTVQLTGGAQLLRIDDQLDASLLLLAEPPPDGAVFSGWDASYVPAGTIIAGIHHPLGSLKKVSQGTAQGYDTIDPGLSPPTYIVAKWSSGATYQGSSGSGLFTPSDGAWYLRGGLRGGSTFCTASRPRGLDYYSRLDYFYPSIQQYLDPASATAIPALSREALVATALLIVAFGVVRWRRRAGRQR